MKTLKNKTMKAEFLQGLKSNKYSINDLLEDKLLIVMDKEDGGFICHETGETFTENDREKGIVNGTWIEL